ncbi:MAG: MauE/DoxX family redox-associated membrane protein [Candidatus Binatus sp.]|uniref:MauE/DoxX family redox-associated membrane protein n=1 Tax=Candidatus Binatus sp. TaxID=2811406 RepID=UPI0027225575|nr:MauE/DoxX family redox-associated membrane protein [Candidatus Binatus sp.]MDO8432231.1 MauE/DoxX family redox-associated membrane protein [Candidatus Binatus sp.]
MIAIDPTIDWTISVALALIFVASAVMKLIDLNEFHGAVENYRIVPEQISGLVAGAVPIAEIAGAIGLMLPATHRSAAMLLSMLLIVFTASIAINLLRGRRNIDCGCFGPALRQQLSWWLPARNAAMIAMLAIVMLPATERPLAPLDIATIAFAAATLAVLYSAANYLVANAPHLRALEIADA